MLKRSFILILFSFFALNTSLSAEERKIANSKHAIQLALLLDSSGSMSGLIEQAKSQLWSIVNEFNELQYKGKTPEIRIGLYEYGNDKHGGNNGYIKQLLPFTSDVDEVSRLLFAMQIGGSSELCPQVVHNSLVDLEWGKSDTGIRMIYIAGNEIFQQGPITIETACALANAKNVRINTIFCGPMDKGMQLRWKEAAQCGEGTYMNIDQNERVVFIESPFDKDIEILNRKFNSTYVAYGANGQRYRQNQIDQDINSNYYGGANEVMRSKFKISSNYYNDGWDLGDAYKTDKNILLKKEVLPEELKNMKNDELEEFVKSKLEEREEIACELRELQDQRTDWLRDQKAEANNESSLGVKVSESIRKEAIAKGYKVKS